MTSPTEYRKDQEKIWDMLLLNGAISSVNLTLIVAHFIWGGR